MILGTHKSLKVNDDLDYEYELEFELDKKFDWLDLGMMIQLRDHLNNLITSHPNNQKDAPPQ